MKCGECESKDIVKHGIRKNSFTEKQVYHCRRCRRFFTEGNPISPGYPKEIVQSVLTLFSRGYSYSMIRTITRGIHDCRISRSTIHRWVHKDIKA